jgi:hypothetical protein
MDRMSTFRWSRWAVIVAVAAAAVGCSTRRLAGDRFDASADGPATLPPPPRTLHYQANNRNVDLLFLVDNSSSMRLAQDNLMRNFPVLMTTLRNLPGGLPNVHVAVISSDMGAGDGSIASCEPTEPQPGWATGTGGSSGGAQFGGDNGIFQYQPRGTCVSSGLQAGATFISDVDGVRNYTGNLEDVFTCIAVLGEQGCGFEHQFAAITRALGVDGLGPAPAENQGFLRPDAYLAIVLITDEDDCSAAPNVPLYDTGSNTNIAAQLGPVTNFRCNEFGHRCNGAPPSRSAPNNDVNAQVAYEGCTSNDADGFLLGVRDTADRIRALKADDGQIMISAIAGARAPYVVGWKAPSTPDTSCNAAGQTCPWPVIQHSCTAADGSFADPAVRIGELVDQFGATGRLLSLCETDFSPALADIAGSVVAYVNEPCILGRIAKKPGTTREDCTVLDNATGASIPACADTGGTGRCWSIHAGGASACGGVSVAVQADPPGTDPAPLGTTVDCSMCAAGVADPARGCP